MRLDSVGAFAKKMQKSVFVLTLPKLLYLEILSLTSNTYTLYVITLSTYYCFQTISMQFIGGTS